MHDAQDDHTAPNPPRPVTPMSILAAELDALATAAGAPGMDPVAFRVRLAHVRDLACGLDPYLAANTTPASAALQALAAATAAEDWGARQAAAATGPALEQEMLSGHIEGQTLKMLVAATGARAVLEVGLFTGYSALAMAEGLPADGRLVACEIDDYAADFAERHIADSPQAGRVTIRRGPAAQTLAELADAGERFDFVFIDADKAGYIDYLERIVSSVLLAPNGLVCVDNTLMQGQPWQPDQSTANGEAIAVFNRAVAADTRLQTVQLPLRDGLTLIRRRDD